MTADFDLQALYGAMDAKRAAAGLTWAAVARAVNSPFEAVPAIRAVSSSTIKGIGTRSVAEGDGVLQMLIWLDRTPESFVPGSALADAPEARLRRVGPGRILRFDAPALYRALDERRVQGGHTWAELASELHCMPGNLTGLANGPRVAFPFVMRATGWLGRPAAAFTRASEW